jgi:hypothetical protein
MGVAFIVATPRTRCLRREDLADTEPFSENNRARSSTPIANDDKMGFHSEWKTVPKCADQVHDAWALVDIMKFRVLVA